MRQQEAAEQQEAEEEDEDDDIDEDEFESCLSKPGSLPTKAAILHQRSEVVASELSPEAETSGYAPLADRLPRRQSKFGQQSSMYRSGMSVKKSAREKQMDAEVGELDAEKEEKLKVHMQRFQDKSAFKKVLSYNNPIAYAWIGIFCSLVQGSLQPIFGIIFSKLLVVLTLPRAVVEANYVYRLHEYKDYEDFVNTNSNKYCWYICGLAGATVFFGFISKFAFGVLGENVTLKIR